MTTTITPAVLAATLTDTMRHTSTAAQLIAAGAQLPPDLIDLLEHTTRMCHDWQKQQATSRRGPTSSNGRPKTTSAARATARNKKRTTTKTTPTS